MFPAPETARRELELAAQANPGLWVRHSQNTGEAARRIAARCPGMDSEKAYVCGLLHDIGRRTGVAAVRHIIDGYDYAMAQGWDEVARVCLTHSFPIQDIEADIGKKDITPQQYRFIQQFLEQVEYDEYDRLIILCDSLADANGFCILKKRLVNTTRRYGAFPFTVERWNRTFAIKEAFEARIGCSVYRLLPGIEACIFC